MRQTRNPAGCGIPMKYAFRDSFPNRRSGCLQIGLGFIRLFPVYGGLDFLDERLHRVNGGLISLMSSLSLASASDGRFVSLRH